MKWISRGDTWEGTADAVACACKNANDWRRIHSKASPSALKLTGAEAKPNGS